MKKIHIVTVDGSPMGVTYSEIESPGVGGSEKYLLELSKSLSEYGYEVTIYNNPRRLETNSKVIHKGLNEFDPNEERDILISFRGHRSILNNAKRKLHIGLSTDQFTAGDYREWYDKVDKFIGISQFHKNDHLQRYGQVANKMQVIDIGCDIEPYKQDITKIENQAIYCSVPERGLVYLADWWDEIKSKLPDLKLVITGSTGLWNNGTNDNDLPYRMRFAGKKDIKYLGRVPRSELIKLQLASEIHLFPCIYDENFCMALQETQVAGCFALSSNRAALNTTNRFGTRIQQGVDFKLNFINAAIDYFSYPYEERMEVSKVIKEKAQKEWAWRNIIEKHWLGVLKID